LTAAGDRVRGRDRGGRAQARGAGGPASKISGPEITIASTKRLQFLVRRHFGAVEHPERFSSCMAEPSLSDPLVEIRRGPRPIRPLLRAFKALSRASERCGGLRGKPAIVAANPGARNERGGGGGGGKASLVCRYRQGEPVRLRFRYAVLGMLGSSAGAAETFYYASRIVKARWAATLARPR